jgi:hypothetical protein
MRSIATGLNSILEMSLDRFIEIKKICTGLGFKISARSSNFDMLSENSMMS